jgi:hypothetical protein
MGLDIQEEEGCHWKQQSIYGSFVPIWYAEYSIEWSFNWAASSGNSPYAHDAITMEREAMNYGATATGKPPPPQPPSIWDYWWGQIYP